MNAELKNALRGLLILAVAATGILEGVTIVSKDLYIHVWQIPLIVLLAVLCCVLTLVTNPVRK